MKKTKNKKGVSPVIGYILLIAMVIVMSLIVYEWLRTYVPGEVTECPSGVSVYVKDYNYDCANNQFNFTLRNNGRFSISGYVIRASNDSTQEIATISLTPYYNSSDERLQTVGNYILNFLDINAYYPGQEISQHSNAFNLSQGEEPFQGKIHKIEIIPIRREDVGGRARNAVCTNARIIEEIVCTS